MVDRRLQVFYTVAQLGSLTRAARVLHMTQPAVTAHIRRLEDYYHVRLFDRHPGGVTLTDAGRVMFHHAGRIIDLYGELDSSLRGDPVESAQLTLAATPAAADFVMAALLQGFRSANEELELEFQVSEQDSIIMQLGSRLCDLAVLEETRSEWNVTVEHVWEEQLVVIASADHPAAAAQTVRCAQLVGASIVCQDQGAQQRSLIRARAVEEGVDPAKLDIRTGFSSLEAVVGAVSAGVGVAVVPETAARGAPLEGGIVCLGFDSPLVQRFYLVRPNRRGYSARARALLDHIAAGTSAHAADPG